MFKLVRMNLYRKLWFNIFETKRKFCDSTWVVCSMWSSIQKKWLWSELIPNCNRIDLKRFENGVHLTNNFSPNPQIIAMLCFVAVAVARPGILLSEEYHGNSAFALRHGLPIASPVVYVPQVAYAHSYGYDDLFGYSAI